MPTTENEVLHLQTERSQQIYLHIIFKWALLRRQFCQRRSRITAQHASQPNSTDKTASEGRTTRLQNDVLQAVDGFSTHGGGYINHSRLIDSQVSQECNNFGIDRRGDAVKVSGTDRSYLILTSAIEGNFGEVEASLQVFSLTAGSECINGNFGSALHSVRLSSVFRGCGYEGGSA